MECNVTSLDMNNAADLHARAQFFDTTIINIHLGTETLLQMFGMLKRIIILSMNCFHLNKFSYNFEE